MSAPASRSMTHTAYEQLRKELLECRFTPGERLRIADLCQRLSVSQGIVREALSRLTAEGLVESLPQRGFRVMPVSSDDLWSLSTTRSEIECLCLKRAMEVGDLDWESGIVAAFHRLSSASKAESCEGDRFSETYIEAYSHFYDALIAACDNPWLMRVRNLLVVQTQRYQRLSAPWAPTLLADRRQLMEYALARDKDAALPLLARLMLARARILVKQLEAVYGPGKGRHVTNSFGYSLD